MKRKKHWHRVVQMQGKAAEAPRHAGVPISGQPSAAVASSRRLPSAGFAAIMRKALAGCDLRGSGGPLSELLTQAQPQPERTLATATMPAISHVASSQGEVTLLERITPSGLRATVPGQVDRPPPGAGASLWNVRGVQGWCFSSTSSDRSRVLMSRFNAALRSFFK